MKVGRRNPEKTTSKCLKVGVRAGPTLRQNEVAIAGRKVGHLPESNE